jgi:hypothetical protein
MQKVRWETLILAAAILIGCSILAFFLRPSRYWVVTDSGSRIFDNQTGTLYQRGSNNTWQEITSF